MSSYYQGPGLDLNLVSKPWCQGLGLAVETSMQWFLYYQDVAVQDEYSKQWQTVITSLRRPLRSRLC